MAFNALDTPRTEAADLTRLSHAAGPDYSTQNSIPSPTAEDKGLLKQLRSMRAPDLRTPRSRVPLAGRRNPSAKNEFTPLLKSAAKNRLNHGKLNGKENMNLRTPLGLKADYQGRDSPGLPFNSSMIIEEETGSFTGEDYREATPAMPVSSSSAMSTPMALPRGADIDGNNLASLREQEARLEQFVKENFSLKLKIHFLEEALRKNGKDFNEAALKENTELKVDKVTLQRDLKHYRKCLADSDKELQKYKKDLVDYAELKNRRHADEDTHEELAQLKQIIASKESEIAELARKLEELDQQASKFDQIQDEVEDLNAELREKERLVEEKDDEIERLQNTQPENDSMKDELLEKDRLLKEKDEDIQGLQDALQTAAEEAERRLHIKERQLEEKDDELRELEEHVKGSGHDQSLDLRNKDRELLEKNDQIAELHEKLQALEEQLVDSDQKLESAQNHVSAEQRRRNRVVEEKDLEIHALQKKHDVTEQSGSAVEILKDEIQDLQAELREQQRQIEERDDQLDNKELEVGDLKQQIKTLENDADEELLEAKDRIQELESMQTRQLKELQSFREASWSPGRHNKIVGEAQERVQILEDQLDELREDKKTTEQSLQKDIHDLSDKVTNLLRDIEDKKTQLSSRQAELRIQRESFETQSNATDAELKILQQRLENLRANQDKTSNRELELQKELSSEKSKYASKEANLQRQIDILSKKLEQHIQDLTATREELTNASKNLEEGKILEQTLNDKIIALEDEIEVLDSGIEEDDHHAKRHEERIQELEVDLLQCQVQRDDAQAKLKIQESVRQRSVTPVSSPRRELQQQVDNLNDQLASLKVDRENLRTQLHESENAHHQAKTDLDTLQLDANMSSGSRNQLQQKLQELQGQLVKTKAEKDSLQDSLAMMSTDVDILQSSVEGLEASRDNFQKQAKDSQAQLKALQRNFDSKLKSLDFERDDQLQELREKCEIAQGIEARLTKANETAERTMSKLNRKIADLELDLKNIRTQRPTQDTTAEERKDLHEMLKDAKLEAEDFMLQIQDRNSRIESASAKELELRQQLKRLREERASQTNRARSIETELDRLQLANEQLVNDLADLQSAPNQSRPTTVPVTTSTRMEDADRAERRHAAELRGLVKQIEYLGARCRREEAFRHDLSFIKSYFVKQVEMYGKCTTADIRLVKAMGIPTGQVLREEEEKQAMRAGRLSRGKGRPSVPSLKCVGLMVVASVRMGKIAQKWRTVRKGHESLLKKLQTMTKDKTAVKSRDQMDVNARRSSTKSRLGSNRVLTEVVNR